MRVRLPAIPRAWRSAIVAIFVGLLAPVITLTAPHIGPAPVGRPTAGPAAAGPVQAVIDKLDTLVYDSLYQFRGPHVLRTGPDSTPVPGIPEVVIVTLDDNSAATVNELYKRFDSHGPPYPRRVYAELVRKLKRAGATVIGIDLLFSTPSGYNRNPNNDDDDREFAAAIKECGNVVLPVSQSADSVRKIDVLAQGADFPIEPLRSASRAVCPVNIPKDSLDNDVRRFRLTMLGPDDPALPTGEKYYAAFGPMIAALHLKASASTDPVLKDMAPGAFDADLLKNLEQGEFANRPIFRHRPDSQTLGDPNSVNICFAGYPGQTSCALRGIGETLEPRNSDRLREWFNGKIALIGSWSVADQDFYDTPLIRSAAGAATAGNELADAQLRAENRLRYGVDVHANVIHTLLSGHYYRDFDENGRVALVWVCALITTLLVARFKPVVALVPVGLMIGLIGWYVVFSFAHYQFLRPVQIGISTVLAYGLDAVYFFSVENRRAQRARSTFQRYVGPSVMQRVLDTDFMPGTIEQRHLTIMFTDVQGFTALSEKMSPHEVVATFNRYLNEMVAIIDKYEGTLDKIMGDGVMAYFNAPVPVARHEQKAVECALEMQRAMRSWRELSESLGLPPLKVRIGINAGEVVFGEVGARRQLGYTVIGDAVNAAARLEPLNKEFGTEILISEIVRDQLDDTITTEYVGELAIRGREEGIRAYSVTGRNIAVG